MRTPTLVLALLALSALTPRPALATAPDELMPCKKLSVKLDQVGGMNGTVKFLCKAPPGGFAMPEGAGIPTSGTYDVGLFIYDLGSDLYVVPGWQLDAGRWLARGNPAGSKGLHYKDPSKNAPCRVVVVTPKQISGTCRAIIGPGNLPVAGDVALRLRFPGGADKTYCAQFGGTSIKNDAGKLLLKNAPAPAVCPALPF